MENVNLPNELNIYTIDEKDNLMYKDAITGLPNINYLRQFAQNWLEHMQSSGKEMMIVFCDVIALHAYNNKYGYAKGDELMRIMGKALADSYPNMLVGRGTDDHFIVLAEYTNQKNVENTLKKINDKIIIEAYGHTSGIHAGICKIDKNIDAITALDYARKALIRAGAENEFHCHFYIIGKDRDYQKEQYIIDNFNRAINENWIRIYYQPILRTENRKITLLEALARWIDPINGVISPADFIPILSEYHLLYRLDLFMTEQVCKEFYVRADAGLPTIPVSVNFSAQDFDYVDVPEKLNEILAKYNIEHKDIIVEITEQDIAQATEHFKSQLDKIHENGYVIWLDDFGSGYSALNVFSRFGIDLIKFDMELLHHLDEHNGANRKIMKAFVNICREMGVHTLTEGVENEEQLQFLREIDCEMVQGFYFFKPEPVEDSIKKFKSGARIPHETTNERNKVLDEWLKKQVNKFQVFVDNIDAMTCVMSVEKLENGRYGDICIVTGNKAYIESIKHPAQGMKVNNTNFKPNSPYTDYLPRDLNFEAFCYSAAVEKKCLHAYSYAERHNVWFNIILLPLYSDDENICYCSYTMEIHQNPDTKYQTNVNSEIATAVLETSLKLLGTQDFKSTMQNEIIKDINALCDAQHCCILLMNTEKRTCSILCEAFSKDSKLLPMETYLDDKFYDIAESWESTIDGSNCIIAKNEQEMEVIKERNPIWHESLSLGGAKTIILFPLKAQNELLGYIWAINFNADNAMKIKEVLELTTVVLSSHISNYLYLNKLKVLSSIDMLTGILNRNEMNNYVDELCQTSDNKHSVVAIMTDLNGLKTTNDQKGHPAGDQLLKNAATALRCAFENDKIFRAGGDEFVVIIKDGIEKEMNRKIEKLRTISKEYEGLYFAVGSSIKYDLHDVRKALREADAKMYEDKRAFYKSKHLQNPRNL